MRPHRRQPTRLPHPWDSPGKNTGVGCHFLLQRIFPTQGSNPHLLHCRQILHHWAMRVTVQYYSFACGYLVLPAEGTLLSPFCGLGTLVSIIWPGTWEFPYGLYSVPLVCSICLYTSTTLSWFLLLCVVYFEIRIYEAPNFVLLFKDYFGCL